VTPAHRDRLKIERRIRGKLLFEAMLKHEFREIF
jgi:hypothetical protein